MKKLSVLFIYVTLVLVCAFAHGTGETVEKIHMAVMQGPTGFSASFVYEPVELEVYPSPNEAISKLINGELDMAVLPANTAVALYNKGVDIKAVAIVGEGMLSILGTDSSLNVLSVPGSGGTPDQMAKLLYPDYELDYGVSAPAQLAQMLIAGKTKLAILPQPFVSMVLSKSPDVSVISDVQKEYENLTGCENYPMSILVVRNSFFKDNKKLVDSAGDMYRNSVKKVLSNKEEAGKRIEELGIMKASLAIPALDSCALVYKTGDQMKTLISQYCKVLDIKVPDGNFWLK